jgi:hypothetical protein
VAVDAASYLIAAACLGRLRLPAPVPLGQVAVIPIAAAFGDAEVALAAGIVYAAVAALVLAVRSVRQLQHETV